MFKKKRAGEFHPPAPTPGPSAFAPLRSMSTACSCMRSPAITWRIAASSAACALAAIRDRASWLSNAVRRAVSVAGREYPFVVLEEGEPEMSPDGGGK